MKPDDILDAIGNIDEACVKKAKEKKKSHKALWIAVSSFAACLVIALILPSIVMNFSGYGNAEVDDDKSADRELAMAYENAGIYYTDGRQILHTEEYCAAQATSVFALWKEKNGIGDEVELIDCRIDSNSAESTSRYTGEDIVTHIVGNHFVLNITISKNMALLQK